MENVWSGQASARVSETWMEGRSIPGRRTGIARTRRQEQARVLELPSAAGAKRGDGGLGAREVGASWSYDHILGRGIGF